MEALGELDKTHLKYSVQCLACRKHLEDGSCGTTSRILQKKGLRSTPAVGLA